MTQFSESTSQRDITVSTAVMQDGPSDAALLDSLLADGQTSSPQTIAHSFATGVLPVRCSIFVSDDKPATPAAMGADQRLELVHDCQGIVRSLAWKIHRKLPATVDLDDLIAYGQIGLMQAARDFDPGAGNKFTTYAYWRVRGAILDGLSQMSWFKRQDFHASKYEVTRHPGAGSASPANDQAAAITTPRTADAVNAEATGPADASRPLTMTSIGTESSGDGDSTGARSMADQSARTPPTQSMMREMMEHVRKSIELLPPESAILIRAAYFEGVTLHEAGRRLGISRAWTSRLHARALEKLKRELRSHWA